MDNVPAVVEQPQVVITVEDAKKYFAPNATDKELYMFLNIANRLGLDPVKREVHFVKYGSAPGQTVVGYQVYLKRAEATGKLNGWKVIIHGKGTKDERAVITIYRKDREHPLEWEVFRSEVDKQQSVWKQMPQFMLKKVAISQGFRLAFPEELGGLPYIPEEINGKASEDLAKQEPTQEEPDLSQTGSETTPPPHTPELASENQRKAIFAISKKHEYSDEDRSKLCRMVSKDRTESTKELTKAEASAAIEFLNKQDS